MPRHAAPRDDHRYRDGHAYGDSADRYDGDRDHQGYGHAYGDSADRYDGDRDHQGYGNGQAAQADEGYDGYRDHGGYRSGPGYQGNHHGYDGHPYRVHDGPAGYQGDPAPGSATHLGEARHLRAAPSSWSPARRAGAYSSAPPTEPPREAERGAGGWPGGAGTVEDVDDGWDRGRPGPEPPRPPDGPDDGGNGWGGGGDGDGGDGGSWRRVVLPALLALGAATAGAGALALDQAPTAADVGAGSADTPVLSARRVPEVVSFPVAQQRLTAQLQPWTGQLPADSCLVVEGAGATLFAHNPTTPLPGASTQKLVTSTAALHALGPDSQFQTLAAATAAPDGSGVVAGDLYLVGGGDPLLATATYAGGVRRGGDRLEDVAALANAIEEAGVTRIRGSVIGDDSRYDQQRFHPAWPERFRSQNQIGPVSALNVNDGFASFPATYGDGTEKVPATDPAANAAAVLTSLLEQRGIAVDGAPGSGRAPEGASEVAALPSAPLHEIVAQTLTDSDNDTAEMLFKELAVQRGEPGTWEAGAPATTEALAEAGFDVEGVQVVDGSGLSDQNRLTCQLVVDILSDPDTGEHVVEGLAVAGESGTLDERFDGTSVAGRLRGKTGTLNNVSALSGQVTPEDGGALTFSYIATMPEPGVLTYEQLQLGDQVASMLVGYSDGIDEVALLPLGYPTAAEGEEGAPSDGSAAPEGETGTDPAG